jgi:hypothetical protein
MSLNLEGLVSGPQAGLVANICWDTVPGGEPQTLHSSLHPCWEKQAVEIM